MIRRSKKFRKDQSSHYSCQKKCSKIIYKKRRDDLKHKRIYQTIKYSYYSIPLNHFFALSLLWGHPGRQHGLRFPARRSSARRTRCSALVSSFFTIVTRQIHSLRANGVREFHTVSNSERAVSTSLRSSGTSCTTPVAMSISVIRF